MTRMAYKNQNGVATHAVEDWLEKMLDFTAMAKLTELFREKTIVPFIRDWKPLIDFLPGKYKDDLMTWFF